MQLRFGDVLVSKPLGSSGPAQCPHLPEHESLRLEVESHEGPERSAVLRDERDAREVVVDVIEL
jgi:hypothetical protein